jgi:hypothetical protein
MGRKSGLSSLLSIHLSLFCRYAGNQVHGDFAELLQGGFEVFDDLLGEDIRVRKVIGFFEAFVSEPEDFQAAFGAVDEFFVFIRSPSACRARSRRRRGGVTSSDQASGFLGVFWGILRKPFGNSWHILLKIPWDRKIQNTGTV